MQNLVAVSHADVCAQVGSHKNFRDAGAPHRLIWVAWLHDPIETRFTPGVLPYQAKVYGARPFGWGRAAWLTP